MPQNLTHVGSLEAMNALEWFNGYAGHEAFHHRQIEALLASFVYQKKQ